MLKKEVTQKEYVQPDLSLLKLDMNVLTVSGEDATSPYNMEWYLDLEV